MNTHYCAGRSARSAGRQYDCNPYSRKVLNAYYLWCAGWNDEDIRLNNMRYFVNDLMKLVRTDDTGKYEPTGAWREVTSNEWDEFRKQNKAKRK